MGRFYYGQIVSAWFCVEGKTKKRPAVIMDGDEACNSGDPILLLMISSKPSDPIPDYHIQVHDSYSRHPQTKLDKPCWAKCNIIRDTEPRKVEYPHYGYMPTELLDRIAETLRRLQDDDEFDGWE